ncbi:MAG: hypothetical protein EZS28_031636, partial [Streblomastix strix]
MVGIDILEVEEDYYIEGIVMLAVDVD